MSDKPTRGTVIATVQCFSCDKDSPVKLDKNGRAYWVCVWPTTETGNRCNAQIRYPWKETDAMVAAYVKENSHAAQSIQADREAHYGTKESSPSAETDTGTGDTDTGSGNNEDGDGSTGTYLDYVS